MFPQGLDFLSESALTIVRVIAAIGGAFVGWFVCDPLTRLVYRITARSKTPGWLLPWTKLAGAITLALLIYFYMPLGGGSSGTGGGGWFGGGGTGKGTGKGTDGTVNNGEPVTDKKPQDTKKIITPREVVDIEILGGERYKDDGNNRYYRLLKKDPAMSLPEVEEYFKKNHARIQVNIRQTDDSIVMNSEEDPTRKLQKLANENYKIPTRILTPKEGI